MLACTGDQIAASRLLPGFEVSANAVFYGD